MNKKLITDLVPKVVALLLLLAAGLKGYQLITEPVANKDIWSYRPFLIFTVEFEIALAIWLLSGLFRKAVWLAALGCFILFCFITLYKGLTGAESCGCFGSVKVNPWITLLAIDLPVVILLGVFRPAHEKLFKRPGIPHFVTTMIFALLIVGTTTPIMAFNKPAKVTSQYEVLEPESWVGKELPIFENIDIGEKIKKGDWVVLFYHYDCPDCKEAISKYEKIANDLSGNGNLLQVAMVEVPPYGPVVDENSKCTRGRLDNTKEWFVATPIIVLMVGGHAEKTWEKKMPELETIVEKLDDIGSLINLFDFHTKRLTNSNFICLERG